MKTVDVADVTDRLAASRNSQTDVSVPFEFQRWISVLNSQERELMRLRFIEDWEYHEMAAAQAIPLGTVQWRVFRAKKKLAPHLAAHQQTLTSKAA